MEPARLVRQDIPAATARATSLPGTSLPGTSLPERNLDVLRATAVLCVVGCHILGGQLGYGNRWSTWLGHAGVLAFFVHTSIVLLASLERQGTTPGWVGRFYLRRAFRLYPLSIATVLGFVAIGAVWRHDALFPNARVLVSNLALLQNVTGAPDLIVTLWSLPVEVQMYIVLPLCFLLTRHRPTWALGGFVIACGLVPFARINTMVFAPCFLAGVLAFVLLGRDRPLVPSFAPLRIPSAAAAPFLLALVALIALGAPLWTVFPDAVMRAGFCLVLALILVVAADGPAGRLASVSKTIATYSYGIYLSHAVVFQIVARLAPTHLVPRLALGLLGTALASVAGYHLIEVPGIRLGARLLAARESRRRAWTWFAPAFR